MTFLILKNSVYCLALFYILYNIYLYVQSKLSSGIVEYVSLIEDPPIKAIIKNESDYWVIGDFNKLLSNDFEKSFNSKIDNIQLSDCKTHLVNNNLYISGNLTNYRFPEMIRAGYSNRHKKFFIKSTGEELKECEALEIKNNKLYIHRKA